MEFSIQAQPNETSCGPTCLHAVYQHYGQGIELTQVIREVKTNPGPDGGTLAVHLANHALDSGFSATIYTCDLQMFDPTWFQPGGRSPADGLRKQMKLVQDEKFRLTSKSYLEFLDRGGQLLMEDISLSLIRRCLDRNIPIIAGLNCTWLYRTARETPDLKHDDIRGESGGHFVVLHEVDENTREVKIADPYRDHPFSDSHSYSASLNRLVGAIMLGIITYDAKLLVVAPKSGSTASK